MAEIKDKKDLRAPLSLWETTSSEVGMAMQIARAQHKIVNDSWVNYKVDSTCREKNPDIFEWFADNCNQLQEIYDEIYFGESSVVQIARGTTTYYVCKNGQHYGLAKFRLWPSNDHLVCLDDQIGSCSDDEFDYIIERLFGQGQGYLVGIELNPGPMVCHEFNVGYELVNFTVASSITYNEIKDWLGKMEKPLIKMLQCKTIKALEYSNVALSIVKRCVDRKMIILTNILLASCSHRNAKAVHISIKNFSKDRTIRYIYKPATDIHKIRGIHQIGVAMSQMFGVWYWNDGMDSEDECVEPVASINFFQSVKDRIDKAISAYNAWCTCTTYTSAGLEILRRIRSSIVDAFSGVLGYLPQIAKAMSACFIAIILFYAANLSRSICNFLLRCMAEEDDIEVYDDPLPGQSQSGIVSSVLSLVVFASTFLGKGPIDANKVLSSFNASHVAISKLAESDIAKSMVGYIEPIVRSFVYKYLGWEFEATDTERISGWLSDVYEIMMDPNLEIRIASDHLFRDRVAEICRMRDAITVMAVSSNFKLPPNVSALFSSLMSLEKKVEFSKNRCASRIEPQAIYIAGPTAQGKTFMLDVLAANLMAHDDSISYYGDYKPDIHTYCKQKESEYWEEYVGQPFVIFNDAFIGSTTESNMIESKMLMGVCEGGPYACNMAFDRKGKTYFNSPYVLITSNRPNFSNVGLFAKEALERRMNFPLYVQRKKENGLLVEYDPLTNNIDDCWDFYIINFGCSSWLAVDTKREGTAIKMINNFKVYDQPIPMSTLVDSILRRRKHVIAKKQSMEQLMTKDNILNRSKPVVAQSQMRGIFKGAIESLTLDVEAEMCRLKENMVHGLDDLESKFKSISPSLVYVGAEEIDYDPAMDSLVLVDSVPWRLASSRDRVVAHIYSKLGNQFIKYGGVFWQLQRDLNKMVPVSLLEVGTDLELLEVLPSHRKVLGITWYISCLAASVKDFFLRLQKSIVAAGKQAFSWLDDKVASFVNQVTEYSVTAPTSVVLLSVVASIALISSIATVTLSIMVDKFKSVRAEPVVDLNPLEDYCAYSQSKFNHVGDAPKKLSINARYHMPKKVSQMHNPFEGIVSFMNNSRIIEIQLENGHEYDTNILMISDKVGFIVKHAISFGPIATLRVYGVSGEAPVVFLRSNVQIKDFPDRDLARIKFEQSIGFCKNYVSKLKSNAKQHSNVYKPIRLTKGVVGDDSVRHYASEGRELVYKAGSETCSMVTQYGEYLETRFKGYYVMIDGGGFMGACGFPVRLPVTSVDNEWLVGIHIGQVGNDSLVCPIYKEDCSDAVSQMNIFRETKYNLNVMKGSKSVNTNMAPAFEGKMPYCSEKSNLVSTGLDKDIYQAFPNAVKMYPAQLGKQAYNNSISKYDEKVRNVGPNRLLEDYAKVYPEVLFGPLCATQTRPRLPNFDFRDKAVVEQLVKAATLGGSVYDVDGMKWDFDSFKDMKAAGPPDFGKKNAYWNVANQTISWEFVEDVVEMVHRILDGENFVLSVKDDLKDELREEDRSRNHKSRLFCSANTHQCVLQKILFMPIVQYFKNHRSVQPIQCGINVHGRDWNVLAGHILRYSNFIGGDQSGQDITIPRDFSRYFRMFLRHVFICDSDSYSRLLDAMCETISTTLHHGRGYTYFYLRGNPSGQWVTSLYSSFATVLVLSYAFIKGCLERDIELTGSTMKENVSFAVFGDDNIGSVAEEFRWFNNIYLRDVFKSFGMEFTSPNKSMIDKEFLDRDELNFLCREFKETRYIGVYSAPLSIDSILGMVTFVNKPKDHETLESKLLEVVPSIECELCHYTHKDAKDIQNKLNKIFRSKHFKVRLDYERYLQSTFLPSMYSY